MDYLKNEAVRPFTIIYNDILDDENLSLHEVAVYIALKRFADNKTKVAFPSLATISKKARICKSSVQKAIAGLIDKGYIEKKARYDKEKKEYSSNIYVLMDEKKATQIESKNEKLEQLKELAAELGYTLSKEEERQDPEQTTLEKVKESCGYDSMVAENSDIKNAIDSTMQIIADTIEDRAEDRKTREAFKKLTKKEVLYSIRKLQQGRDIKNPTAYLKKILARAGTQASLEALPPREKSVKKPNRFNDFPQRRYDFEALEKLLRKKGHKKRE